MTRRAAALLLLLGCAPALRPPRTAGPGEPHLSVLSYNVNFVRAGDSDHFPIEAVFIGATKARERR